MGAKRISKQKKTAVIQKIVTSDCSIAKLADKSGISKSSVTRIMKTNKNIIEAKKKRYIAIIEKTGSNLERRAKALNDSLLAETEIYNFKGQLIGTRPDHKQRLDTIKYIDKLSGFEDTTPKRLTQNNTIINTALDKYTRQ